MPNIKPTQSGKAWEYGLARKCANILQIRLTQNSTRDKAQCLYNQFSPAEQRKIDKAAEQAIHFLCHYDKRLKNAQHITMQSDARGRCGDVRDILVAMNSSETIGISAKHRHKALKHSRLSEKIDFGKEWYGVQCSQNYWQAIEPVFKKLREHLGQKWSDLSDKENSVYILILQAFIREVKEYAVAAEMMKYLLGKNDFYKIIKENGNISIQSFNMYNTLKWGKRLNLPSRIIETALKPNSKNTVFMVFDEGWQVSFRIHNARTAIEPSLKFDINLKGHPNKLTSHSIPYG